MHYSSFMKKTFYIVLGLALLGGAFYFLTRSPQASDQATADQNASDSSQAGVNRKNSDEKSRHKFWTKAEKGDASLVESPRRTVTHQAPDFTKGEMENMTVTDGLAMGNDPSFSPHFNPNYKMFGVYISPEEGAVKPFDRVIPKYDATVPANAELTFAFRTRTADTDWTVWQEVAANQLNQPMMLDNPATSVQYRLMLFGNDSASGPKVRSVSLTTQTAVENFSANNIQ